mgnify:CR=1 FL=1|tara:strand:- start:512 stop:724 length:213 start_codon:yes stop_codon:yes gene_type:complete
MKRFKVVNKRKSSIIYVVLHNPPYENENILYKTSWNAKDCEIEEVHMNSDELAKEVSPLDIDYNNTGEEK